MERQTLEERFLDVVRCAGTEEEAVEAMKYYARLKFERDYLGIGRGMKRKAPEACNRFRGGDGQERSARTEAGVDLAKLRKDVVEKLNHNALALVALGLAVEALLPELFHGDGSHADAV